MLLVLERIGNVSLTSLSPFHYPCVGRVHMALSAYYDGSGKTKGRGCRFVTLAGYSATGETWDLFEPQWKAICLRHGAQYLHMSEAWALVGEFDMRKGWNALKVKALVEDLLSLVASFRDYTEPANTDLLGFSCTVNLTDYRAQKKNAGGMKKTPAELCVDWCTGHQLNRLSGLTGPIAPGQLLLYFDRREEFLHQIYKVWKRKIDGKRAWWGPLVGHIGEIDDMRSSPAIQLADLLAWSENRHYTRGDSPFRLGLLLSTGGFQKYYDATNLFARG